MSSLSLHLYRCLSSTSAISLIVFGYVERAEMQTLLKIAQDLI